MLNTKSLITSLNGMQGGSVAMGNPGQLLLNSRMNPGVLRPWIGKDGNAYIAVNRGGKLVSVPTVNATLRKDEWNQYDDAILKAAQIRLVAVGDLISRGLTYSIGNGLGTTVLEYEDMSDVEDAQVSMDGTTRGNNDRVEFDLNYLPLPITHADFQLNIRVLEASRKIGASLDTTIAEAKAQKIAEKLEEYLVTGSGTYTYGSGTIYGYVDFPHRNSVTLEQNWDASGKTGAEILQDVKNMKQASINDKHYGPWVIYIPTAYETVLDSDYVSGYPKTIRQRILEISGIEDIKVVDKLTANNVLMIQMSSNVVRMVNGMGMTTVEWNTQGGMIFNYKIMTIQVPQLRADQNNRTGIVHLAA